MHICKMTPIVLVASRHVQSLASAKRASAISCYSVDLPSLLHYLPLIPDLTLTQYEAYEHAMDKLLAAAANATSER